VIHPGGFFSGKMTYVSILLALALAPGAYLAFSTYLKDKYEPEPKKLLLGTFLTGCIMIIPAAIIELGATSLLGCKGPGLSNALLMSFLVVGPVEEGAKFWVLRYYAYPKKEFNEPFDGIVYGAFVALGFATLENVFYVLQHGFAVGILRMFISVPGHYAFGVIMGYYLGKAKFEAKNQARYMRRGFFSAVILHGAFDFFILQKIYPALYLFTIVVLVVALRMARREIKELQADSLLRSQNTPPVLPVVPVEEPRIES